MSTVTESNFWTVFDAAVYYGVSQDTVRRMVRDKEIVYERVRGAIRIPKARDGFSPLVMPQEAPAEAASAPAA